MVFRVTKILNDQQFLFNNTRSREEEAKTLERISTLKKVNRASDQPADFRRIQSTKADLAETASYQNIIEGTLTKFHLVEDTMGSIRDDLEEARAIALQGTSNLNGPLERETIADELQQLRLSIINRLNTRHEGEYIFSGTAINTQPFQDPATGNYSGNAETLEINVSPTDTVTVNFPGDELAYGPGGQGSADDVLDLLADLETAFRANDMVTINAELPRLRPVQERINQTISEVGTRSVRLLSEQSHYDEFELNLRAVLSDLEDADLAEEALNLEATQNIIQGQLRSHGSTSRQSLLDFIG